MRIRRRKVKQGTYQNTLWHFSLDLGMQWYEPQGLLWWLQRIPPSTVREPLFRHEHLPIQANIVIGPIPKVPSWQEQHQFAKWHYAGRSFYAEDCIEVLGAEHYTVAYLLGGIVPTKKYSLVFIHPKRNQPIEFVFTISVYTSIEEFEHLIEDGDNLVKSFRWLGQDNAAANTNHYSSSNHLSGN
jgi:hypothetical protein